MFYNDESQWIFAKSANMKFYMFNMLQRFDYRKCDLGQCKWEPATTHMYWKDVFRPCLASSTHQKALLAACKCI